jgi:2-C-methyl-D-erythritol 2,4-cyclodiphosphate synthase
LARGAIKQGIPKEPEQELLQGCELCRAPRTHVVNLGRFRYSWHAKAGFWEPAASGNVGLAAANSARAANKLLVTPTGDLATLDARVGIGHDTHRLAPGGPLLLGGVPIPHDRHCIGHSDADVLLHAITDALLGAAALGDIGELFPDTDAVNRGRDSAEMLAVAWQKISAAGFRVANLDCVVFAQRPKLSAYKDSIRRRIADLLQLEIGRVAVKAKTGEGVGPVGREEAIMAQAIVLLEAC